MLVDIFVLFSYISGIGIYLGHGNGSFSPPIISEVSFLDGLPSMPLGDFNNDNRLDIVIPCIRFHNNSPQMQLCLFLGYGNGSFQDSILLSPFCDLSYVSTADINNDNALDIVVTDRHLKSINILLGYGNGSFSNATTYSTGTNSSSIGFGDFNNDSLLDIVVTYYGDGNMGVFLGYFNRVFIYQRTLTSVDGSLPQSFTIDDFNNDTHMDISVVNAGTNNVGIFLGIGNGSFSSQMTYSIGSSPCSIAVGDFNKDTHLDIVVVICDDNTISVLLGYGNGSFTNRITFSAGAASESYSVAVADFDNDTFLDIIVANYAASNVVVFLGHGDGTFKGSAEISIGYATRPFSIVVGDFNSDKKVDFVLANYGNDNLEIYFQNC
jgi:hypothetical protein